METAYASLHTQLGWLTVVWTADRVARLTFGHNDQEAAERAAGVGCEPSLELSRQQHDLLERLIGLSLGEPQDLSQIPIEYGRTGGFSLRVLRQCQRIPWGETVTYRQLAQRSGSPLAARAVGNVMSKNRVPLVIPCHRVVASNDSLGGFSAPAGIAMKQRLLRLEGINDEFRVTKRRVSRGQTVGA